MAYISDEWKGSEYFKINDFDHVEFYVGNAKQAAHFYKTSFGFQSLAYSGLETEESTKTSYVLVQDKIRLVLTTPMSGNIEIEEHITKDSIQQYRKRQ